MPESTDHTAYQRICAEACELCAKGLRQAGIGGQWHSPDGVIAANWPRCTAPTKDAVIERLAGELERVREEAAKLGHEPGCASSRCDICCGPEDPEYCGKKYGAPCSAEPCNCAQSRIQVKP